MRVNAPCRRLSIPFLLAIGACSSTLPEQSPPLADIEAPLDLRAEPDDETARAALPAGSFSGLVVDDARDTLAAKLDEAAALRVASVVENSPAAAAGLQAGDLLLEAQIAHGPRVTLRRASEWRHVELENPPGTKVALVVDRAGREATTELQLTPRVRPAPRTPAETFREEDRVGVVLRTATEVEARAAGLGPGGGAVVIGLARSSPWRRAGLRFGDLIVAIDGAQLAHPQQLLAALREPDRASVHVDFVRTGEHMAVTAPVTVRAGELTEFSIPLLVSYSSARGKSDFSLLLGLFGHESTAAAWRVRLLWLITFGGGDSDRLLEVDG